MKCTFVRICCVSRKCCLRSHLQVRHQCVTPLSTSKNELGADLPYVCRRYHFELDFRNPTQEGGVDVGVVVWWSSVFCVVFLPPFFSFRLENYFRFACLALCFLLLPSSVSSCSFFTCRCVLSGFRQKTTDMIKRSEKKHQRQPEHVVNDVHVYCDSFHCGLWAPPDMFRGEVYHQDGSMTGNMSEGDGHRSFLNVDLLSCVASCFITPVCVSMFSWSIVVFFVGAPIAKPEKQIKLGLHGESLVR